MFSFLFTPILIYFYLIGIHKLLLNPTDRTAVYTSHHISANVLASATRLSLQGRFFVEIARKACSSFTPWYYVLKMQSLTINIARDRKALYLHGFSPNILHLQRAKSSIFASSNSTSRSKYRILSTPRFW